MLTTLRLFLLDIFSFLSPEMALAGGIPMPPACPEKPDIFCAFGGLMGGHSAPKPNVATPPTPPTIVIPPPPNAPAPPPPPMSAAVDTAAAQRQGQKQQAQGFGAQASLLRTPSNPNSPNGTVNSATGTGSLLGNK